MQPRSETKTQFLYRHFDGTEGGVQHLSECGIIAMGYADWRRLGSPSLCILYTGFVRELKIVAANKAVLFRSRLFQSAALRGFIQNPQPLAIEYATWKSILSCRRNS